MPVPMMEHEARRPWNAKAKPQLHQWLVKNQSAEDKQRLKVIGNIVMPKVGQLGLHLLEHELRSEN